MEALKQVECGEPICFAKLREIGLEIRERVDIFLKYLVDASVIENNSVLLRFTRLGGLLDEHRESAIRAA